MRLCLLQLGGECYFQARNLGKPDIYQSESEGLWIKAADDVNPFLRAGRREDTSFRLAGRKQKGWIPPSFTFCSIQVLKDWTMPVHSAEGALLSPLIEMLMSSWNTHIHTNNIMFNLAKLWPVRLAHDINHHSSLPFWWLKSTKKISAVAYCMSDLRQVNYLFNLGFLHLLN